MRTLLFRLCIVLYFLSFLFVHSCTSTRHVTHISAPSKGDVIADRESQIRRVDSLVKVQEDNGLKKEDTTSVAREKIDLHQDLSKVQFLEEPIATDTSLQIYHNTGFAFAFSPHYKQSLWVAYQYLPSELQKVAKRVGAFKQDPRIKGTANNGDYTRTGYDKGHLAPAGDMAWSENAMKESFYFTNISPQLAAFNRGIWKELEEQVRFWVTQYDTLYVTTGPLFLRAMPTIGHNQISIPSHFYKALLTRHGGNWQAVGFLMENKASQWALDSFRCTIDSLERLTGLDFFPLLADSVEVKVESKYNKIFWHAK